MNKPLVSIIVPTYNSDSYVEPCLKSICEQSYQHIELIVVDNNSSDKTKEIARQYTNHLYDWGPERSAQRNYGVKQSQGEYVLIIDSDMVLSKHVVKSCVETMLENHSLKTLIIPEESFGEGFWAQCKKLERSFYSGLDWQEGTRFFERRVYDELGGYDEEQTGSEDYDLPNRLEYRYGKTSIARIKDIIYHNERRISLVNLCRKKFYYAATLHTYIKKVENRDRLLKQTSFIRRYWLFLSHPVKLFKNPLLGLGMLFMKTCEIVSGVAGYIEGKFTEKRSELSR
jgi:glycosyltransferase involved in cell wall biosynthesis